MANAGGVRLRPTHRVLRRVVRALAFASVTVLVCAVGLLLCINTPLARTLIADAVTRSLAGYFCGEVVVESIGRVGLSAVRGIHLSVIDPDANQVLRLRNLDAHLALVPTLRNVLSSRGTLEVTIAELSIEQINLYVQSDANSLNLQRAFRVCAPPSTSGRAVRLAIRKIRAAHLLSHVELSNVPAFDADLKHVGASLLLIPGKLAIDVDRFALETRGLINGADVAGAGDFKFVLPLERPREVLARAHWTGRVYGTDLSVEAQWLTGLLRFSLDAPQLPAQTVRRFWGEFPEGFDANVHAELQGTPPEFALQAHVARGRGALDVSGRVSIGERRRAELHVAADSIDLNQVLPNAPPSGINASADIVVQQVQSGPLSGELRIELPQNRVAGIITPPASVQGTFLHIPGVQTSIDAGVVAHEAGVPAKLSCRFTSNGKENKLTFEAGMHAPRLDRVARLSRFAQGGADVSGQGTLDFARGTLNASVGLDISGFHRSGVNVESARGKVSLHGALSSPRIELDAGAKQLEFAGFRFSDAHAQAHGGAGSTRFKAELRAADGANVGLTGQLGFDKGVTIHDFNATFDRGAGVIQGHANTVRVQEGGVAIDALRVGGLGEPVELTLALSSGKMRLRAMAKELDVAQVARVAQLGDYRGHLNLDADLSLAPGRADGRVAFSLSRAQVGRFRDWSAQGEANLHNREFFARVQGNYGEGNWLELQTDSIRLGGPGDELAHWRTCSGRVAIDARVDIEELLRRLPGNLSKLGDFRGRVGVRADIERTTLDDAPANVTLSLAGTQLAFLAQTRQSSNRKRATTATQPLQFRGIDASLGLAYDGGADQTRGRLRLSDATGVIAALDVSNSNTPWRALAASPMRELVRLPLIAQLQIPKRSLKSLPGGFVPERYLGDVESRLIWQGSLERPDASLEARITQARIPRTLSRPFDVDLIAHYDGQRVDGKLKTAIENRTVLDTDMRIEVRAIDWLAGHDTSSLPWVGSVRARLIEFPIERIRALGNSEVSGVLNGALEIEGLHRDAKANLKLEAQKLRVRDLVLTGGTAQVVIDREHFDARARLEENTAYAELRLNGAPKWGDALLPVLDDARPVRAALSADQFRIATLLPFTNGLLSDLDGRAHAELSAEINHREGAARLSGVATLRDGVFELAAGGGEFRHIDATLVFKPDGSMELQNMRAQGATGHLQLTARTRFDGFGWASTEAHLQVPANGPVPLTLQGAGYGTAFGQIDLLAVRAPNRRDVLMDVDVPSLNVMLPDSIARSVQKLEPIQGVRFGSRKDQGAFEPLPMRRRGNRGSDESLPSAQVKVNLNLGKEVKVAREGSLEVVLTGHPQIVLSDSLSMTGQIQLVRGFLDIEGKRFEIEQGTVSFVGDDPSNPQADVTASWSGPDGTVVYADFSGPLRSGKVTLRSDPPLSKNDILALMLFGGTRSGSSKSANQAQLGGANVIGVTQGAATQPINHALQDYGLGGVSTRVDTSNVNPRPEVEVRIARDIALQIAWVLGTPPPGSNPDRTLFTIDWRFFRRWALETTVGDAGTSIADVVWQYGY